MEPGTKLKGVGVFGRGSGVGVGKPIVGDAAGGEVAGARVTRRVAAAVAVTGRGVLVGSRVDVGGDVGLADGVFVTSGETIVGRLVLVAVGGRSGRVREPASDRPPEQPEYNPSARGKGPGDKPAAR